jgi:acyl-CoA synthetase (AMP-forming)/AMP-acid ligase II
VITTKAGLYRYAIGDTVKFVSDDPYRIIVTGRTKQYISAFGEHVIGEEVESAIAEVTEKHSAVVRDFHLAPQVSPKKGLPHHEWFVEFDSKPSSMKDFSADLCASLQARNTYYADLLKGGVLQTAVVTALKKNAFTNAMSSMGKLGGQNKVPRLSNDRKLADLLVDGPSEKKKPAAKKSTKKPAKKK